MLKFVPDHLNTMRMCNYAVEKLSMEISYHSDQYKTQEMCVKAADICAHALESFSDRYK